MLSERRLRDWVALLGFDVERVHGVALSLLPLTGACAGIPAPCPIDRGCPTCSKARKRLPTLTMVRPRRRARQRVLVGAAEPTNKVRNP